MNFPVFTMIHFVAWIFVSLSFLIFSICTAFAEKLTIAVSSDVVWLDSNFTGAEIVLFGAIQRDAHTIARKGNYDIVVVLRGPPRKVSIWRKERVFGAWINRSSVRLTNVPNYLGLFSNRPLEEIATNADLRRYHLGLQDGMRLDPTFPQKGGEFQTFHNQLISLMKKRGLYLQNTNAIRFLNDTMFTSRFPMPLGVPPGVYTAHTFLFGDGAMLDQAQYSIHLRKGGLERLLSHTAMKHPVFYGLFCVLAALSIGWIGAVIFRRD